MRQVLGPYQEQIVIVCIESLSDFEDSKLNYYEQHASGSSEDYINEMRVKMSKDSTMSDILRIC